MMGRLCGRVGLAVVLGAGMLFAQQPTAGSQANQLHAKAAAKRPVRSKSRTQQRKAPDAAAKIPVQVVTGGDVRTVMLDAQPAGSTRTTTGRTTVQEINGAHESTRVFQAPSEVQKAGAEEGRLGKPAKRAASSANSQPATERVEVINGRTSYTATFRASAVEQENPSTDQRVVTGVESSRMRAGVQKSQPVVVGVSSNEQDKPGVTPVVVGVASSGVASNRPIEAPVPAVQRHSKRRPYVPNPVSR